MKAKEKLVLVQNLFLIVSTVLVLCGTSAPIVFQFVQFNVHDASFTCGAPYYNGIFVPLVFCIMILLLYMHTREYILHLNTVSVHSLSIWIVLTLSCVQFSAIYYWGGFSLTESLYGVNTFVLWCVLCSLNP
jgi:cytochrome c biogenesis factor